MKAIRVCVPPKKVPRDPVPIVKLTAPPPDAMRIDRRKLSAMFAAGSILDEVEVDERVSSIKADLEEAKLRLSLPQPHESFTFVVTEQQAEAIRKAQAVAEELRAVTAEINAAIKAAPCRSARWRLSTWAPCDRCGHQTRAVYLDGKHRHMICEARP